MYMHDVGASLVHRWYLFLLALLASGGLCLLVADLVPATYESKASIVLVPPESTVNPVGENPDAQTPRGNPYLYLGGLDQALDVVIRSVDSAQTHETVARTVPGEFEVTPDWTTSAPLLVVKAEAATSAETARLLEAVLAQVPVSLGRLQDRLDIPAESRITTFVVAADETPLPDRTIQIRLVALAGGGSLALFALVIAALDGLLQRRRQSPADDDAPPLDKHVPTDSPGRPSRIRSVHLAGAADELANSPDVTVPTGT